MSSPGGPEVDQESPERLVVVLYALATGWRCKNTCIADSGKRERRGISRRRRAGSARTSYSSSGAGGERSGRSMRVQHEDLEAADRVAAGAAEAAVQTEDHIPEETTKEKTEKAATKEEALATTARRPACPRMPTAL
ncbi:hypothetical protein PHYSODRAFT_262879 [Phytophthora sojae]|uniref:Uncharacterized protein n=1 Tax=Phytophthora sojae (strain P6497) TaxID=1094619 RepID=G4ZBU7_PHYSP|nr:hypothetical protein PHYSODRAFT_262879 [Phytophthora sojae]EGZ21301.1 hypothetical protein PHYSODRAFT_262879 [Phytophthora sojae]|eukprot:XP_009524018.1 hypothetical protein PHYSODRAFT_262879 [Phytophthora sojae]